MYFKVLNCYLDTVIAKQQNINVIKFNQNNQSERTYF